MLQKSQGDALVYSTLVGFGLVGVYAGYRVKSRVDFLSGIKTQPGMGRLQVLSSRLILFLAILLALNWIASS